MRTRSNALIAVTVGAVALATIWLAMRVQGPASAQVTTPGRFPAHTPARTADGKPDLNGSGKA
jgi:hypothetical protein